MPGFPVWPVKPRNLPPAKSNNNAEPDPLPPYMRANQRQPGQRLTKEQAAKAIAAARKELAGLPAAATAHVRGPNFANPASKAAPGTPFRTDLRILYDEREQVCSSRKRSKAEIRDATEKIRKNWRQIRLLHRADYERKIDLDADFRKADKLIQKRNLSAAEFARVASFVKQVIELPINRRYLHLPD